MHAHASTRTHARTHNTRIISFTHNNALTIGTIQIQELGTIETPIILTNTLSVGTAFDACVRFMLSQNPGILLHTIIRFIIIPHHNHHHQNQRNNLHYHHLIITIIIITIIIITNNNHHHKNHHTENHHHHHCVCLSVFVCWVSPTISITL